MSDPIRDVRQRGFFDTENMEALAEPASYGDWAAGPNEDLAGKVLKPRPLGDYSDHGISDGVEIVDL
jgi:hypothetical protein